MCGLCGIFEEEIHWGDDLNNSIPRRQERFIRIKAINRIVSVFKLTVADFQGSYYLIQGPTGRQEIVQGLDGLWGAANLIMGKQLDPLDINILERLEKNL